VARGGNTGKRRGTNLIILQQIKTYFNLHDIAWMIKSITMQGVGKLNKLKDLKIKEQPHNYGTRWRTSLPVLAKVGK
jgi:hypothetical protein